MQVNLFSFSNIWASGYFRSIPHMEWFWYYILEWNTIWIWPLCA